MIRLRSYFRQMVLKWAPAPTCGRFEIEGGAGYKLGADSRQLQVG